VGELGLPQLCRDTPALAEQVLRTLLWHLDRINDHQPRLSREAAIAEAHVNSARPGSLKRRAWKKASRCCKAWASWVPCSGTACAAACDPAPGSKRGAPPGCWPNCRHWPN
jgi:hypothetical protein